MWATPDDRNSPPRARPKKGKMVYFCQVDACRARLSSCKPYCLRYRVCPAHLNAGLVDVEGVASRFCQQCGKFHPLQEFDGTKKSCRTRLQHHNSSRQQRRKEAAQQQDFNTTLLLLHHPGTRNAARQLLRSSSSSSPKAAPGSSTADGGGSSSLAKLPSSSSSSMGTSAITTAAEGLTNSPSSKQQQQQPDFVMVLSKGLCFRDDQQQDVKLEGASSDAAAATAAMSAPHAAAKHTFRNVPPQQQQQQQESAAHGSQITAVDNSSKQHSPPWQQQQLREDTYAVLSRHNTADSSMAAASTAVQPFLSPSPPAAAAAAAQTLHTDASPSATAAAATRLESAPSGLLTRQDSAVNDSQLQPWTQAMLRDGLGTGAANPAAAGSTGCEAALYNAPNPAATAAAARVPARVRGSFVAGSYARCTVPGCIDCVEGNITVHYCNVPGCTECPPPPPHVIAARQQQQMLGHQQPQQQTLYQNAPPSVSWQQQQQQEGIASAQGNASDVQLFAGLPMHTSSAWDLAPAAAAAAAPARYVHFSPNITMQHSVGRQQQQQQNNMHYELSVNTPAPCTSLYGNARASSNAAATRLTMHQASTNSTAAVWSQNSSSLTQGPPVTPNSYYTPTAAAAAAGDSAMYGDSTPGAFNHTAAAAADGASAARWQPAAAAAAAASRDRGFKQIMPQMLSRNAVVSLYSRWSQDGAAAHQLGGSSSSSREDLNASVARLLQLPANAHVVYSSNTDAAAAIRSEAAAGSSFGNASDLGSAIMVEPQNASLPEHQLWSAAAAAGSGTAATHYQMAAAAAEQLHYVQQGYNAPHGQVAFADTGSAAAAAAAAAAVDGFHTNATYYNPAMSNYEQADNRIANANAPAAAMHDGHFTEHPSTAMPAAAVGNFTAGSELGSQASYTTARIGSTAAVATTAMHGGMYSNSNAAAGYAPRTHQQQQQQQTMVSGFDQFQPAAYHDQQQQQQQQCLQLPRLLPKVAVETWTNPSATWQQQQQQFDAAAAAAWSAISPEANIYGGARSVDVAASAASAYTSKGAFAAQLAAAHTNAVSMNNAMMQEGASYMPDHPTAAAVANAHAAAVRSAANMMISDYMPQQADQVQIRSGSVPVPDGQASLGVLTDQAVPGPDTFWSPEGPDRQPPVLTDQAGTGSTITAAVAAADLLLPTLDTAAASQADDDHCQDSECKYLADFFQQWAGEGDDDVIIEDLMDSPTSWCERADQPL